MIRDILNYIDFLEKEYGLSISIHSAAKGANSIIDSLTPHNIHKNPYCLYIKADKERHNSCIEYQNRLRNEHFETQFHTCMCGVSQFIVPINHNDEYLGFICAGGYKCDELQIKNYASDCGISYDILSEKASSFLKSEIPTKSFIETVIKPLCSMLAIFLKNSKNPENSSDSELYNHILSIIHGNAFEPKLTINTIAKMCFCSSSMVSHLFKRKSGITVNRYITNLRMKKAEELLKTTNLSVTEVAYSCGYTDSNYFVYAFGKAHGAPPLKYKKGIN